MSATFYPPTSWLSKRLRSRLAAVAAGLLLTPAAAWAQAPANDNCSGAIALTPGATCTVTAATNLNATASTGVPAPGSNCFLAGTAINNDVWYSIVVPSTGAVTVTTSASTGSSLNDTGVVLYSGTCTSLTEVGCSDDISTANTFSSATVANLPAGSTIYARVWSFGATPTGAFGICAVTGAAAPANDNPSGAIALTLATACTPVNGTNAAATTTTANGYANPGAAPFNCGIAVTPKDVWYSFTTAATGAGSTSASIQVTGNPAGYIRAFSATSATGPFTEIGCASGGANNTVSQPLNLSGLTPSTTYYVSVAGYGSADTQGAFTICATSTAAIICNPPTTVAVGNITTTTASVTFTPGTGNTSYVVTYYPTANPAATTTVTPTPTASPVPLTGLTPNTAYTVTIQPLCSAGGTTGLITRTFTTNGTPPANDDCAGATVLTPGAPGAACSATNGTVANATQSNAPILCGGFTASTARDVWYSFTATSTTHTVTITGTFDGVLEVLSGACGTLTNVACSDAVGNNETLNLTGLTVGTPYRMRYYPYTNAPASSTFSICITTLPASDAAVQTLYTVGKAPVSAPQVVQAVIRNTGANARPASAATLTITGATTFTDVKVVPALAVGASATITFTAYTPSTVGTNTLTVTLPADDLATNNSLVYAQAVTANSLSYVDDTQALNATGVGVSSTTAGGTLASKYSISSAATVGEVKLTFPASATTTSTYQVVVLSATTAGLPDAVLFTSPTLSRPTAAGVVTVPVTGNVPVNGTFFVGLKEVSGNVAIGYQVESPLRPATFYFQTSATGAWTDVNTTTLTTRLAIEVGFATRVLSNRNAALEQALSVFPNPAHDQLTLRLPALAGQRTAQLLLTNALGQQVLTRTIALSPAGTDTQLDVSGLAKGIYTLRVLTNNQVATKQLSVE